jgi:hypothetical protein
LFNPASPYGYAVIKRAMRFELTTFTLAKGEPSVVSADTKGLTEDGNSACTTACTSNTETANEAITEASGRGDAEGPAQDPRLDAMIESWPTLPEAIKAGIVAMVKASTPERRE